MSTSPYNVLGIGQPLIDRVIKVDEETLAKFGITEKGGSSLLNQAALEALLKSIEEEEKSLKQKPTQQEDLELDDDHFIRSRPATRFKTTIVPGGSCANTIKGLAGLGEKCALIGKIGKDEMGQLYKDQLSKAGVIPLMTESPSSRTGEVVCLITPDGQRTMRAFLGASDEMHEKDLLPQDFKDIKLFHVEGYAIYNLPLMIKAMQYAKQHGALISYDLGSFEVVRRFKSNLVQNILKEYVDIVFANEEEAKQLTSPEGDAEDAVEYLADLCHVAVVMMGPKGCWVKSQSIKYRCRIDPVTAVDTTGAGDCFASAFLYAYLQGYTVEQCARLGSLAGKAVVQVIGAGLTTEQWKKIKSSVNDEQLLSNSGKSEKQHSSSVPKNMGIRKKPDFFLNDDDSSLSSSFSSTSSYLSSRPTGAIAITKK